MYKMRHLPPTSLQALISAGTLQPARPEYIYIGNRQSENARILLSACRKLLIQRVGFAVLQNR